MFSKSTKFFLAFLAVSLPSMVTGREQWLERDGRAVQLYPRRFGQENPPVIAKLSAACPGQICGVLAGAAITPLLAAQPECSQQDHADAIIDAAKQFDAATQANMIALAIEYRQAEKNTPPDFTTNPPTPRNSVFCQKAPKNPELNGLIQAQDPANDPTIFFDPATKATVRLGDQPNTFPFGQSGGAAPPPPAVTATPEAPAPEASPAPETPAPAPETPAAAPAPATGAIGNFGSCSVPQIEFAAGFDNRRETSFRPVDLASFNHGSAQNPDIIMQFVCDTLVNSCGADQTARATCATARAAANAAQPAKTGIVADTFNAGFGISTNFAAVQALDNQGAPFGPIVATPATPDAPAASASPAPAAGGIGNFGSCSVPQIEFAAGFDNRKETSFRPVDLASFNHGSAQNPDIIMQFVCDTLVNSCGADQTARNTCATARAAANAAQPAKTGIVADTFNAGFGISTNFAAVQALDNQGAPSGPVVAAPATPTSAPAPDASTPEAPAASSPAASSPAAGGIGDFGRCTVPQIEFGVGFDNRKESSFRPVDLTNFNHGSAQNIDIITRFVCDQLVNFCGADQTARATCATAITAASSAAPVKTGIQADAFNAVFGITTNFASVQAFDDQGRPFGPTGSAAPATPAPVASAAPAPAAPVSTAGNLQTFTAALGGVKAPVVTAVGNAFQVENNASFNNLNSALRRSCDVQVNLCSNAANASGNKGDLTVANCGAQGDQCRANL